MNSSEVRMLVDCEYQYTILNKILSESELKEYHNSIYKNFTSINWDDEKYSEWLIRNYLSIKMILSSSVMLTSCESSIDNNNKIYSLYHTMTEGMVEDFFGAWLSDDADDDGYNPDKNWRIIFNVP